MRQRLRATGPLRGAVQVPGDKSISHRALICNALADGEARVRGFLDADDCRRTRAILEQLGARISDEDGDGLLVSSPGRTALRPVDAVLDCGNSGTSMRLLAGLLAGLDGRSTLDGDASLRRRPMARVLRPLAGMGAAVAGDGPDMRAPITVGGGTLRPFRGRMTVPSAQVK
ncbi:MAG: 3-phosphoshikimate 1-carboxyvinyltransferase, partial [Chloroflexi bacterium]|nr:3-phosphoshikimate 1-carboxyvinyltransferase [Chloroflexota bacterium]